MARTRQYSSAAPSRSTSKMSQRHRYTSSSSMGSPTLENRSRRGRQARPSQLTSSMHHAVRRFASSVGAPNVVEPAGFRDFRGWLARLQTREVRPIWDVLIADVAREVKCDVQAVHNLKEDIVREIVKCVVIPRPDESAKLVSTNAGRQAGKPRTGTTLMLVLEQQLARVDGKLHDLVQEYAALCEEERRGRSSRLPGVSDLLQAGGRRSDDQSLPSFKELDASIRQNTSS